MYNLDDILKINLDSGLSKENKKEKAKLFFKIMQKYMVEEYFMKVFIDSQSPQRFLLDLFYILMEFARV